MGSWYPFNCLYYSPWLFIVTLSVIYWHPSSGWGLDLKGEMMTKFGTLRNGMAMIHSAHSHFSWLAFLSQIVLRMNADPGMAKALMSLFYFARCVVEDKNSKVAWLNRSGIIFAGHDKWSLDPRVELEKRHSLEYSLRIQKVDVYDEGSYTCSVQTQHEPKTSQVYLIVQGKEVEKERRVAENNHDIQNTQVILSGIKDSLWQIPNSLWHFSIYFLFT